MLASGQVSAAMLSEFIKLTSIKSTYIKKALSYHLTDGVCERNAYTIAGVSQPNFSRALKRLNKAAITVESIIELRATERSNKEVK